MRTNPFGRRHDARRPESEVESALRRSLAAHAFEAPDARDVTERILAATEDAPDRLRRLDQPRREPGRDRVRGSEGWQRWTLPLVAALLVAAVVGIGSAVLAYHPDGHGHTDQAATNPPVSTTTPTQRFGSKAPSPSSSASAKAVKGTSGLTGVKIIDLTFYRGGGTALASAKCSPGSGAKGRCLAMLRTTNGTTWKSFGGTFGFQVPGVSTGCPTDSCVYHVRFETKLQGFAYGPQALFYTSDGGSNWTRLKGGAEAVETLAGNVIRITTGTSSGCLPGCPYTVETSPLGTPNWTPVKLPGGTPHGDGVQLSRATNGDAYLLVTQSPTGGSGNATSTLYRSTDAGKSWFERSEPCPQSGGEVDSYQVTAGGGGRVTVLCRTRLSGPFRVAVSTDAGAHFAMQTGTIPATDVASLNYLDDGGSLPNVLYDSGRVLAVVGNGVYLSTDHGKNFVQNADLVGRFSMVGFESKTTGRAVSADGSQIWTTLDAGKTWTRTNP